MMRTNRGGGLTQHFPAAALSLCVSFCSTRLCMLSQTLLVNFRALEGAKFWVSSLYVGEVL